MKPHIEIIGVLLMILSFIHVGFPKYFNWKEDLKSLSLINRQMMHVHTFFIALVVFLIGLLCVNCAAALIETQLGKQISLGLGVFWCIRLFMQFFVYSSELWKGKKFETSMHILFSCLWVYFSAVFLLNAFEMELIRLWNN
jgi:hypothetical protein